MTLKKFGIWLGVACGSALLALAGGYLVGSRGLSRLPEPARNAPVSAPAAEGPEEPGGPEGPEKDTGYRIRLMEEASKDKGKNEAEEVKETRETVEGAEVIRRPLGGVFLSVIVDASAGMAATADDTSLEEMKAGLAAFLEKAPAGLTVGVRTMGGVKDGGCGESLLIMPPGEPGRSMESFEPAGRRNISRTIYLAAGDLATYRGRKGVVILTGGEEQCGEWPCETARALNLTRDAIRTFALRIVPPPPRGEPAPAESGEAAPGSADAPPAPAAQAESAEAPPVTSALECLGRDSDGFLQAVSDRDQVAAGLQRVAAELSRNVTVRIFGARGRELTGASDPLMAPWKAEVASLDGMVEGTLSATSLPARFTLLPGRYRIAGTYGEARGDVSNLAVNAGEDVEVRITLRTGQLVVMEGKREWPEGTGCQPLIRVESGEDLFAPAAEKCGLPAQFVLDPGTYLVHIADRGRAISSLEVGISAGETAVIRVSPGEAPALLGVDKGGGQN